MNAPPTLYLLSLGCPKNQVDTELMLGQVAAAGHSLVDSPDGSPAKLWATTLARRVLERLASGEAH